MNDAAPAMSTARQSSGRALSTRCVPLLVGAVALALGAVALQGRRSVRVNGVRVPVERSWTVADCARFAGLQTATGDLLDVHGKVLQRGGGRAARAWRDGSPVRLAALARHHDSLRFTPACDLPEPIADKIEYLPATCRLPDGRKVARAAGPGGLRGMTRTRLGARSGKLVDVETTRACAIVLPAGDARRPKCVAFTFDDGPNPHWTPRVLDTLSAHGARGTFFVLGQAVKPISEVFERTVGEGHEVGTHSWSHRKFPPMSDGEARTDLRRCIRVMKEQGAEAIRWFRPPWGEYTARTKAVAAQLGLGIAMWDIDTLDWQQPGVDKICQRITRGLKDGAVILMHDGPRKRQQTVAALKRMIPALRKRGYQAVTMSEARGLVPVFGGEFVLQIAEDEFRFAPLPANAVVRVNAQTLSLCLAPLRCGEDILMPVREIATALGASVSYDKEAQTVRVNGAGQDGVFPLNSTRATINGQERKLHAPSLLYSACAFVPLSALKSILDISCVYDGVQHILTITRVERAQLGVAPLGAPSA